MAMTGYYRTLRRPRTSKPLSMLKYDPVGTLNLVGWIGTEGHHWLEYSKETSSLLRAEARWEQVMIWRARSAAMRWKLRKVASFPEISTIHWSCNPCERVCSQRFWTNQRRINFKLAFMRQGWHWRDIQSIARRVWKGSISDDTEFNMGELMKCKCEQTISYISQLSIDHKIWIIYQVFHEHNPDE